MNPADQLESEFKAVANQRHGILLLSADHACDMIQRAEKRRIEILGIDSFILKGDTIQPNMENSIDFSSANHAIHNSWKEGFSFINERKHLGFAFEVVLGNQIQTEQGAAANP
jgi:hypothetical protein